MNDSKFKTIGSKSILTIKLDINNGGNAKMLSFFNDLDAARLDSKKKSFFGDQSFNDASLHLRSEFECLTLLVEYNVRRYMDQCGYNCENLALFHQKAWPVITHSGGKVMTHSHPNSDLSVVYYLQCEWGCGGNLVFNSDDDLIKPGLIKGNPIRGLVERSMYGLKPIPGLLVIFPSNLNHYVSEYTGSLPRYSITYDISLAASASLGSGDSENFVIHPSFWREFSPPDGVTPPAQKHSFIKGELASPPRSEIADFFDSHGYHLSNSFLPSSSCEALLKEIIYSWGLGSASFVKSPAYRLHTPLSLSDSSLLVLRKICSSYRYLLDEFLSSEEDQFLVELSSITSFPGAQRQELHRDHKHFNRNLITFFVNLLPAGPSEGSIGIVPGSHVNIDDCCNHELCQFLDLPAGSIVAMNGALAHAGGANVSGSCIRPVWYCTFGSNNMNGPTYSIKEKLKNRYKYLDFLCE